jgi:hypothetical protein
LPGVFRLEGAALELHHQEAVQAVIVEQQIDVEILVRHLDMHLAAGEGKALTQFHQQLGDMAHHRALDVPFQRIFGHAEKIEEVGILQGLLRQFGIRPRQALFEVGHRVAGSQVQRCGNVMPHHIARPAVLDGLGEIPFTV